MKAAIRLPLGSGAQVTALHNFVDAKSGTGSEVTQRIAVPMIKGMVSSTILTLIVIPAVYALVKGFNLERQLRAAPASAE